MASQFLKHIFSIVKAECFVWATVVQLFSFIRIDMVHHTADVFLCQIIHGGTFGEYPANQFMINFTGPLLIRASCVTVKEIRAPASILV